MVVVAVVLVLGLVDDIGCCFFVFLLFDCFVGGINRDIFLSLKCARNGHSATKNVVVVYGSVFTEYQCTDDIARKMGS